MTLPSALWHLSKTIVNPTTEELIRNVKVRRAALTRMHRYHVPCSQAAKPGTVVHGPVLIPLSRRDFNPRGPALFHRCRLSACALYEPCKARVRSLNRTVARPCAVQVGEAATWEKLSAIECNCTIEATLDKCLAHMTNAVRGYRLARMGNRIPSWLHMSAVGLPAVASWGDSEFAEANRGAMPHNASWGAGLGGPSTGSVAAAAPPPPGSGGVSAAVAGGLTRGSPSTHPLDVAASMTSSTLALLNLGGPGGPGSPLRTGRPPVASPVRGGAAGGRGSASSYCLHGMGGSGHADPHRQASLDLGLSAGYTPGRRSDTGVVLGQLGGGGAGGLPYVLDAATGVHHHPLGGASLHHGVGMGTSPPRYGMFGGVGGLMRGFGGGGGGVSVPPSLPTWMDAASECEDSASDAAAAASTGAASSSAAGAGGGSGSAGSGDSDGKVSDELLQLAYCDCTDASARDLWSVLLPLARQSVSLGELNPLAAGGAGGAPPGGSKVSPDPDALDVFAY